MPNENTFNPTQQRCDTYSSLSDLEQIHPSSKTISVNSITNLRRTKILNLPRGIISFLNNSPLKETPNEFVAEEEKRGSSAGWGEEVGGVQRRTYVASRLCVTNSERGGSLLWWTAARGGLGSCPGFGARTVNSDEPSRLVCASLLPTIHRHTHRL